MRASSLESIDVLAEREIGSDYDSVITVADNIEDIKTVASADLAQMVIDIQGILDFTDITVSTVPYGNPAYWDSGTKVLTIPEGQRGLKGDKGDTGATGAVGATGPKGADGVSVHHVKATSTTNPYGDFGEAGYKDTYSLYGDANETILLGSFVVGNGVDGIVTFTADDRLKLYGIEDGATADQTPAEIKVAYESNVDTNAFTDADVAALAGKQDQLVNGVNIKTINGDNVLGSGNLLVSSGASGYAANVYFTSLQSNTVGTYEQLSYTPEDTVSEISTTVTNSGDVLMSDYIFDGDVLTDFIPAGEWQFSFSRKVSNGSQDTTIKFVVFARSNNGTETELFTITSDTIEDTTYERENVLIVKPAYQLNPTDRVGVKVYASTSSTSSKTVSMQIGNGPAAYLVTPLGLRHNQLRARNEVDAHPIGAITGLQGVLDAKLDLAGGTITGDLTIDGNIIQNGAAYETHAEQVFTTKDEVILRDGAVGGLLNGVYSGLRFKLYDGTNDGILAVGNDGIAKVGDEGSLQALATREDNPVDGELAVWNNSLSRFDSTSNVNVSTINGRNYDVDMATLDNIGTFAEFKTAYEGV